MPHRRFPRLMPALLVCYGLGLLWLLFCSRLGSAAPQAGINLVPLRSIRSYCIVLNHSRNAALLRYAAVNFAGNLLLLVPAGLLLPTVFSRLRLWSLLLCTAGFVAAVELLQAATRLGSCDVDDLLLNLAGFCLGYGLLRLFRRIKQGKPK